MLDFLLSQIQINLFFQSLSQWLIAIMQAVTHLGDENFYMLLMPCLYWCINSTIGLRLGAMLIISNCTINGFKMALHMPRPYWLDPTIHPYVHETSFGAPSCHAANAASLWGILAVSIRKTWVSILMIILILLIGVSRLFMGVHFLIDILSSWLLGVCLLLLFVRFEKPVTTWFKKLILRHQVFIVFFSSVLLILPVLVIPWILSYWQIPPEWQVNAGQPIAPFSPEGSFSVAGVWAGFLTGYAWHRQRYGGFTASGKIGKRVLRYLIGVVGLIVFWKGLDMIFPDGINVLGLFMRYLRYTIVGFWISGLAPLVFSRLKLL